jgi:uncharacterized protein YndB with AHSA1/START domain
MEHKTKVHAIEGSQNILITREFDIPVNLLFKAYTEADLLAQWMGTKVLKLESEVHGSYQFETSDPNGNVLFKANGTIHEFIPNKLLTRTFEMENTNFPVQLEFLNFEALNDKKSKLIIEIVFRSSEFRDQQLKMPFEYGLNMAHEKLEKLFN